MNETDRSMLTPREIVSELDKYIVGQQDAKKAVAVPGLPDWPPPTSSTEKVTL